MHEEREHLKKCFHVFSLLKTGKWLSESLKKKHARVLIAPIYSDTMILSNEGFTFTSRWYTRQNKKVGLLQKKRFSCQDLKRGS